MVAAFVVCGLSKASAVDVTIYQTDYENTRRAYSVPEGQLLRRDNRWNPASQDLPIDIASRAEVARQHLMTKKKPERELKLFKCSLARYSGRGLQNDGPWYLLFMYGYESREPRGSIETSLKYIVVMLLDGTIANETTTVLTAP